jgi:hypothetical protein
MSGLPAVGSTFVQMACKRLSDSFSSETGTHAGANLSK